MPFQRVTFFFEGMQVNTNRTASSVVSWTETWYLNKGTPDQALQFALARDENSWMHRRASFLHALYAIKWIRASDVDNPRLTKVAGVNPAFPGKCGTPNEDNGGRLGLVIGGQTTAAQTNCAVEVDMVRLPGADGDITHHRRSMFRGLPNTMINGNILREEGDGFTRMVNFLRWIARGETGSTQPRLAISDWMIRYEAQPIVRVPITALAINALNPRMVDLTASLGNQTKNKKIILQNTQGIQGANRIWTLSANANDPGPYKLGKARNNLAGTWVAGSGSCHVVTYTYGPLDQFTIIGLRNKKFGSSPFGRTRGRRRAS